MSNKSTGLGPKQHTSGGRTLILTLSSPSSSIRPLLALAAESLMTAERLRNVCIINAHQLMEPEEVEVELENYIDDAATDGLLWNGSFDGGLKRDILRAINEAMDKRRVEFEKTKILVKLLTARKARYKKNENETV